MSEVDGWAIEVDSLAKDWEFSNFKESIDFVNKIGEIAERNNHHPMIIIDYNRVHLQLTTHEEKGISEKDFNLAVDIDKIGK